jgi:hypothetical protein
MLFKKWSKAVHISKFEENPKQNLRIARDCIFCRKSAVLEPIPGSPDKCFISGKSLNGQNIYGYICIRTCPSCDGLQVAVCRGSTPDSAKVEEVWPNLKTEVDKTTPMSIAKALDEAIKANGQAMYHSAALNIRRAIEMICDDAGAQGNRLVDRIADLKAKVILPEDLIEGIDVLRIFGNEGAHMHTKSFEIGAEECSVALELVLEINRSLYIHRHLITRLKALKKTI